MPTVLSLNNGKVETILSVRDFEDLIEKHMGYDCLEYYRNQIRQLSDCIQDLSLYINDDFVKQDVEEVLKVNGYE